MSINQKFFPQTKQLALARQKNKCGSCGEHISTVGLDCRFEHVHGESAEAHHIKHVQHQGTNILSNCIILCKSCHFNAHAGFYGDKDVALIGKPKDFPHFIG